MLVTAVLISPLAAEEPGAWRTTRNDQGILVQEGDAPVLFYQRAAKSLDGKYARANYVHPLYDLAGNVLTEDFPADHLHHRGIFWAWHQVRVDGKKIGDPWETRDFAWDVVRADVRPGKDVLELAVRVLWKSPLWVDKQGVQKPLVDERTIIRVHRAAKQHRMIDFEIRLRALEDRMQIGGSENAKGYGGFSTRLRLPGDIRFVGERGEVAPRTLSVDAGRWMHLRAGFGADGATGSVTILCHPSTAGFPQRWILRRARSMQNPVYPGREPAALRREAATILRYRLVLHRGAAEPAEIRRWQEQYERGETRHKQDPSREF